MSIKHIQNKVQNVRFIQPIYPKFGSIGMGQMAMSQKTGNTYPTETPHYVFRFEQGYEDLSPFVTQLFGEKPISLDVVLLPMTNNQDPIERFMPNSMQAWTKSKYDPNKRTLTIECDGETVMRVFDYETKRHIWQPEYACGYDAKLGECKHGCRPTARLRIGLPALYQELGVKGYFEMSLHGIDSIKNLLVALGQAGDNIGNVIWRMTRVPKTISFIDPKDGKAKERVYHPISKMEVVGGYVETPMVANTPRPTLASGDVNTSANYQDDYYPDDAPIPDENPSLANSVVAYLKSIGHDDVLPSDVLFALGYDTWGDLVENWDGNRDVKSIAERFVRFTTQAF